MSIAVSGAYRGLVATQALCHFERVLIKALYGERAYEYALIASPSGIYSHALAWSIFVRRRIGSLVHYRGLDTMHSLSQSLPTFPPYTVIPLQYTIQCPPSGGTIREIMNSSDVGNGMWASLRNISKATNPRGRESN